MTDQPAASGNRPTGHELQVRGAVKRYGHITALAGIDLDVAAGQFLVLLGPSGSGKSTLVRSIAGIERLDGGTLRLADRLVSGGRRHLAPEHRDLAMVFQDYALWPHLTVQDTVAYALRRRRLPVPESRRRVHDALEQVGLAAMAARYPHELSGGEQQRAALARAIVARPGLLLFDEPLSNLDADLRERLRVQIATTTRESGATAVYITHDQSEAFALADVVGVLDRGALAQLDRPESIYARPATLFVARFTGLAGELPGQVVGVDGDTAVVHVPGCPLLGKVIADVAIGDPVTLAVRPAATRILGANDVGSQWSLAGIVTDVAYRGRGYDHVVSCAAGVLTAVFDSHPRTRGTRVEVALDPDGCVVYPNPATAPTNFGYDTNLTAVTLTMSGSAGKAPQEGGGDG
ncbi:ABC transporter ATP-binding protein [Pseudonocardia yunnanensis]|uniref:ABC transporter ATP-binding protein n=1 Tax=Pseudonocardia yunnanensis TaxID=58107 RepID=A0ABW4F505_9PSEU